MIKLSLTHLPLTQLSLRFCEKENIVKPEFQYNVQWKGMGLASGFVIA